KYTENIPDMPVRKIKLQRMFQFSGCSRIMSPVHDHYRLFGNQSETPSPMGLSEPFIDILSGNRIAKLLKDRKSTRLNSSHVSISYAVFCLKKKKYINSILNLSY